MKPWIAAIFVLTIVIACNNAKEPVRKPAASKETLYYDYQVWAEEGQDDVNVRMQYRMGDEEGESLRFEDPAGVRLDEESISPDSTKFMGVFYEVEKPVTAFQGNHSIVFTTPDQREIKQEFNFEPFTLAAELPAALKKEPFTIILKDFPNQATTVRLVMTDTSHESSDVNEMVVVKNRELKIPATFLANLTKGPVLLEIYREEEREQDGSHVAGKFNMTYSLKRQIEFRN